MKQYIALLIAVLIASTTLLTPASAGAPATPCATINGAVGNSGFYNIPIILAEGDKVTIRVSGSGTSAHVFSPVSTDFSIPGSYSYVAKSAGTVNFYVLANSQTAVVRISCGPNKGGSSGSSEPDFPPCYSLYDGRINNSQGLDCAAPIAIYLHSIDIYGINPSDGSGIPIMSINADILKGPVPDNNTLLSEGTNIITGQWVRVYWLVKTAEVEVITAYPDGKPYIVVWPIAHPELLYHLAA